MFNSAQSQQVNISLLEEIPDKITTTWVPFLQKELHSAIKNCNNSLTPELDKLFWRHFKVITKNKNCINRLIDITNACINLDHWLDDFKISSTVIISKPNKPSYNLPKLFQPIVLLNTTGKLFTKMLGERLQFLLISNNFVYPCQLGRLKHRSTTNADIALTYLIRMGWIKNLNTSMLVFDIMQFFPLLNHQLLPFIIAKAEFNHKVSNFFQNYLIKRKTKYLWNNFSSPFCNVDVGVGQRLALSSILSALYFSSLFYILEKWLKNIKIPISILSFVDNGLFISQNKSISVSNANLFCSYNVIYSLLTRFGLVVEYGKTEIFYFSRLHGSYSSWMWYTSSQVYVVISWLLLWSKAFVLSSHQLLHEQDYLYCQMHEDAGQLVTYSKKTIIYLLCTSYSVV